mmetsp:Transcript_7810/g.11786  ORF Transcript_7810/g.11786 Transcript_7810/m.11786 type:complete len:227 (+) Transcript_7810:304-984(+)|eukprot:CAMPEP_0167758862 /NCGR_PEP_ID=MMETSP0110_2-20121227/10707_1 /TAXON_ID=629695 /ORGANISM="Gymnochlora sp., Strain CCMP2014" /LENGTH=226 /DNA_ID=CAMNT_0007645191 /DNA_START=233 /DNA_END=913 /DNA_ORIENTATION=+
MTSRECRFRSFEFVVLFVPAAVILFLPRLLFDLGFGMDPGGAEIALSTPDDDFFSIGICLPFAFNLAITKDGKGMSFGSGGTKKSGIAYFSELTAVEGFEGLGVLEVELLFLSLVCFFLSFVCFTLFVFASGFGEYDCLVLFFPGRRIGVPSNLTGSSKVPFFVHLRTSIDSVSFIKSKLADIPRSFSTFSVTAPFSSSTKNGTSFRPTKCLKFLFPDAIKPQRCS